MRYSASDNGGSDLELTDCPTTMNQMAHLSVLLQWHKDDPPLIQEQERNNRVCERWQGNRNPFVDYPELAAHFFGEPHPEPYNCSLTTTSLTAAPVASTDEAILMSEFEPKPPGADAASTNIEFLGSIGSALDGCLVILESDDDPLKGHVKETRAVRCTFDANGLCIVSVSNIENPSHTLVLLNIAGCSGISTSTMVGDIDPATVLDAVGVVDAASDETNAYYGVQLGGTNIHFTGDEPGIIFRSGSRGD